MPLHGTLDFVASKTVDSSPSDLRRSGGREVQVAQLELDGLERLDPDAGCVLPYADDRPGGLAQARPALAGITGAPVRAALFPLRSAQRLDLGEGVLP